MALVVVAVAAAVVPAKGTRNERAQEKRAAVHWALRLCIAVDRSRRFPAPSVFTTAETERRLQRGYEIP
jgi:hypothetical protein